MVQRDANVETTLDDLRQDLDKAFKKGAVHYYHIGKVPNDSTFISEVYYSDDQFDVYVSLHKSTYHKEDLLKSYIRKKYGSIVRVLVVECS